MKHQLIRSLVFSSFFAATLAVHAQDEEPQDAPTLDADAVSLFKQAADLLASAEGFAVSAEIWQDLELETGQRAQFTKLTDIRLRRPDQLRIDVRTAIPKRSLYFNGKTLSILSHQTGFYGSVEAPGTIDEMIAAVEERAGVAFPLEDILISPPFGQALEAAISAESLGVEPVLGTLCHHLAFQADKVDWQLWIEDGLQPLLRKAVITFKTEEGSPQFTALFSKWDFSTPLGDPLFTFVPRQGEVKVEMITVEAPETTTE